MANILQKVTMSSKFIEHSPEAETDKSLILIMDNEGNVTADPDHFEKIINTKQIPERGIKIVRLDASQEGSENEEENEKAQLKLTVEEIYPENVALTANESGNNAVSSTLDVLPGNSTENIGHDIVEPFLEMDPEQMERLANALASDQAKQMFGENVAAMLDMLNVDESPTSALQNSIKFDHCYTNLLPSSDPNGPSFFTNDVRNISDVAKAKNKVKVASPVKVTKIITTTPKAATSIIKRPVVVLKQVQQPAQPAKPQLAKGFTEAGFPAGLPQIKPPDEADDPNYEEDVDIEDMDSEASAGVEDDNEDDEDYNDRTKRGNKRRPKRNKKKLGGRKSTSARPSARGPPKPGGRVNRRSSQFEEIKARNEKLNDEMAKVVQSLEFDSKSDDDKPELKKGPNRVKTYKKKKSKDEMDVVSDGEKPKEVTKTLEEQNTQSKNGTPKYPKRENRKPPAHLADAFGPALFSTPDIIRRISTTEEVPQTPPEKKNFSILVHKSSPVTPTEKSPEKSIERLNKINKIRKSGEIKDSEVKVKSPVNELSKSLLKSANPDSTSNVKPELIEEKPKAAIIGPVVTNSEKAVIIKQNPNPDIQKLIEKHHTIPPKATIYEEDQDYSDENVEDNYYLDPTQMDQSLLEGFAQPEMKSEEQLLQEAILLQEQLLAKNEKSAESVAVELQNTDTLENYSGIITQSFVGDSQELLTETLETETINNIQNEIASTMVVERQIGDENPKAIGKSVVDGSQVKKNSPKKVTPNRVTGESESQFEEGHEEGNLVVDETRPEDRKRHSVKRRRSDEVSDLDSDLDDALSEASWNSEDDPDRLWCICRKPHNNRFMICCDVCEEWFHGKCVGITKTIGKQMEQDGLEWSCPNCTKKKKGEDVDKESEKIKLLKEKMAQSIKEQQLKNKELQKSKNPNPGGKDKFGKLKNPSDLKQTKISDYSQKQATSSKEEENVGRKCIMCKGPVRENSIYCSDDCIRKHSQQAISQISTDSKKGSLGPSTPSAQSDGVKILQKVKKDDSRITVMDPSSKKVLIGQQAPTAANLATWLKENPSYHVVYKKSDKPGGKLVQTTTPRVVKIHPKTGEVIQVIQLQTSQKNTQGEGGKSVQSKLIVSPNSKQIKIVQTSSGQVKKVVQALSTPSGSGTPKPGTVIIRQKQAEIIEALPMPIKSVPGKTVQVKTKPPEVTSPKTPTTPTPTKESPVVKVDKVQRKRKEKVSKVAATSTTVKESRQSQSGRQDEGKDKEKDGKNAEAQVRESVKKTLAEALKVRVQECKDIEYNEEHINNLAVKIEEKLFKHFENKTDTKYKSKYRSLVFNIKDPKNETLFRKIVDNSVSPKELVKLSPEELASQELAKWREKENQHQLEMIKKTELELMTKGSSYIMKSHKGEQVIDVGQSEKIAIAVEIDPNTPAQELVSALNSVSSTTQDLIEDEEKNKGDLDTSLSKMKKKEKERKRSRDRKHGKRDRDRRRSRSRSRSRSRRSKDKKRSRSRSRSRDRDRDKSKHKHKDKSKEKEKDRDRDKDKDKDRKKGKDTKEEPEIIDLDSEKNPEKLEISTTEKIEEETTSKKSISESFDDADHEPSSTVIIKTPDINVEEPEIKPLWKGTIVMPEIAKFSGLATEISGDCNNLATDLGEKVDVVGRIAFDTVWEYIARMKKMATKDVLVIKIIPNNEEEKISYVTLYNYLAKRSRIGVIGKTSDCVKDFYLYPLASHSPIPQVLLPLDGPGFEDERENIILGIIVRNKQRSRHQRIVSTDSIQLSLPKPAKKLQAAMEDAVPEQLPDRSYTPPLPDKDHDMSKKDPRLKRKIRVHIDYKKSSTNEEDDDSPYSPGDSDEDLPPLPKIAKPLIPSLPSTSSIPSSLSKLLSPVLTTTENLQDPAEIQRKIEEMNRAIEEQTQQIQNLTSTVPELAAALPSIPLLGTATPSLLTSTVLPSTSLTLPHSTSLSSLTSPTIASITAPEKTQLPLISTDDGDERYSPSRSFTPPPKTEESIPFLPEVTSKISLPSNLQEILNSIQKKSGSDEGKDVSNPVEDLLKSKIPEIDLNVLNQTKSILGTLPKPVEDESKPLLSRMSDEDIIRKAKEMEMELELEKKSQQPLPEIYSSPIIPNVNPYPPQPLPPGVQDIPLMAPVPFPPPINIQPPLFTTLPPVIEPSLQEEKRKEEKSEKKIKLDPKSVFESEGVTDFLANPSAMLEEKKKKSKNFKIDIKLAMNTLETKNIDSDNFDIESISNVREAAGDVDERQIPSSSFAHKTLEEAKYDVDERVLPKFDDKRKDERDRRRSDERDRKHDRRHWDEKRRYDEDYRRYGRRDRPKFRHDRDFKRSRSRDKDYDKDYDREKDWEGDIKEFEDRQRRRSQENRKEDTRRLKNSSGN